MAAPAHTAVGTPTGREIPDGFSTKIVFAAKPSIAFWEISVKPPGMDGGEPIQTTSMRNLVWRTYRSKQLKTLTPLTLKGKYDPDSWADWLALVNVEGAMTVYWPDGSYLDFYGFVQKVDPDDHKEGELPMLNVTVTPTNFDVANHVEAAPVFVGAPGT